MMTTDAWTFTRLNRRAALDTSGAGMRKVMVAAARYHADHGTHATIRQVMADVGWTSTSHVLYHLVRLAELGYMERINRGHASVYVPTVAGIAVARGWQNDA